MKIAIVDMGLDKNDSFGTTERGICELSQALVQEGHEVLVLYRHHVEGDYLFPLDNQVKRHRISGESAALSDTAKIRREILRLFSPDMARRMTETHEGKAYAAELLQTLNSFVPDMVILDSSLDSSLVSELKMTSQVLFMDKIRTGDYKGNEVLQAEKGMDRIVHHISEKIHKIEEALANHPWGNSRLVHAD